MAANNTDVAVVMVPFPEYGHLTPLLRLSRLISSYDIPVYFATYGARNEELKLRLKDWKLEDFPNLHLHDLNVEADFDELIKSLELFGEPLCALCCELSSSCTRLVIIHDTFMLLSVQRVLKELTTKIENYIFHGFPALTLYSWIQQVTSNDDRDNLFLTLEAHIPSTESCFSPQFPEFITWLWSSKPAGQIMNASRDLEGPYLDVLAKLSEKPVWGLGPLNPVTIDGKQGVGRDNKINSHACIEWLDKQPKHSVIFVSFGTATTFSPEQINELAIGLERCEHRFIWVLRSKGIRGNAPTTENTPKIELPKGFEERVAERGIIARDWVPQLEVLAHPSTGGYLFHSGGGSFMESIAMGVPMATWPMHSDNGYNDVLITKVLKVGVVVRDWAHRNELVKSDTIANALKTLMNSPEGEEMRQRVTELSKAIKKSWSEGGTTQKQLESFITHITR